MQKNLGFLILLLALISSWLIANKSFPNNEKLETLTEVKETNDKKKSISQQLRANGHLSIEKRIALFYELKKDSLEFYNFENEDELTMYGYSLLWSEEIDEAIEFFKLLVAEFPESANTYDSLGEAYLAKGKKDLALKNYKRSFEMNPDNFYAEDQIARIQNPDFVELTPAEKFLQRYSVSDYLDDLDLLKNKLLSTHPNALKFISERDFLALVESKKALISPQTTFAQFNWYCREIIASINCSHTSAGSFEREMMMLPDSLLFPLQVRWVDEQLFVIDPLNNSKLISAKDEVTSINNVPVKQILKDIYKTIPSQGYVETTKNHVFNTWAPLMIPYALSFPETYKVKLRDNDNTIPLEKNFKTIEPVYDSSIPRCGNDLCLELLNNNRDALLTISSFNYYPWNNLSEFEEFIDKSFKTIASKGSENLIIDLRFNGGGSPESSIYLLKHLISEPFTYFTNSDYLGGIGIHQPFANRFKGNIYFIIDGHGNSTTGHFMSIVKKHNLGVTIGEELGSNHFCTAGQAVLRLPKTKLVYYVANSTSYTDVSHLPDERGILPDHFVSQNIEEYLGGVDAVKNYTLNLLK
jgi:tetratricopeptide (TPR) repeat protein